MRKVGLISAVFLMLNLGGASAGLVTMYIFPYCSELYDMCLKKSPKAACDQAKADAYQHGRVGKMVVRVRGSPEADTPSAFTTSIVKEPGNSDIYLRTLQIPCHENGPGK